MNRADLLITVGARFDDRVTGKLDAFAPGARVVHMDIDPAEISKNREADVPIVGELRQVLPALTAAYLDLRAQDRIVDKREWRDQVEEWKFKHPFRYRRAGALKPEYVLERFRDLTRGKDVVWVTGVGQHQMWAAQWLQIDKPRRWITSGGLGTMGFGVPAAIGAKQGSAGVHRRQHRRRRLLPDDDAGAGDGRLLRRPGHQRRHQQRLARHGAPVAGAVPRRALLRDRPLRHDPGLREARRGVRLRGLPGRDRGRRSTRPSAPPWPATARA